MVIRLAIVLVLPALIAYEVHGRQSQITDESTAVNYSAQIASHHVELIEKYDENAKDHAPEHKSEQQRSNHSHHLTTSVSASESSTGEPPSVSGSSSRRISPES